MFMAGLLTHLVISTLLLIVVVIISRRFWYGLAIFLGQLVPDAVKFGITGIKLGTFSPNLIIKEPLFWELESLMSNYHTWVILGIFIVLSSLFLYYIRKMKKEQLKDINWGYLLFVIGVIVHLVVDVIIIEHSYWI